MSHDAASITTALDDISITTAPESPQLKTFVGSQMEKSGLTEQEVRKWAVETYGSLEYAMQVIETAEAEKKAAIEGPFPNGYVPGPEVGMLQVGEVAIFEL